MPCQQGASRRGPAIMSSALAQHVRSKAPTMWAVLGCENPRSCPRTHRVAKLPMTAQLGLLQQTCPPRPPPSHATLSFEFTPRRWSVRCLPARADPAPAAQGGGPNSEPRPSATVAGAPCAPHRQLAPAHRRTRRRTPLPTDAVERRDGARTAANFLSHMSPHARLRQDLHGPRSTRHVACRVCRKEVRLPNGCARNPCARPAPSEWPERAPSAYPKLARSPQTHALRP